MKKSQSLEICDLPEYCLSHILSLTNPKDVCRSSSVCSIFRLASNSDYVWERMLPPDYQEILSRSVSPVEFSSKKQLYFSLCSPILIDSGTKSFSLERLTGLKSYMLSMREGELEIQQGDDTRYWKWISLPESRFEEVAVFQEADKFSLGHDLVISGEIDASLLSPKTWYAAFLVFKIVGCTGNFNSLPVEMSVYVGGEGGRISEHASMLYPDSLELGAPCPLLLSGGSRHELVWVCERAGDDGWMEVEMGTFFNGDFDWSFLEVQGGDLKGSFAIQGIEIRPKAGRKLSL